MAEIRWTPQAADDLESIAEYIAFDSLHYSQLFVINVIERIERLKDFHTRGRIVPEVNKENIRELLFGNYRIIYRSGPSLVEILTIYHGSRLLHIDNIE